MHTEPSHDNPHQLHRLVDELPQGTLAPARHPPGTIGALPKFASIDN